MSQKVCAGSGARAMVRFNGRWLGLPMVVCTSRLRLPMVAEGSAPSLGNQRRLEVASLQIIRADDFKHKVAPVGTQ